LLFGVDRDIYLIYTDLMSDYQTALSLNPFYAVREYMALHDATLTDAREAVRRDVEEMDREELEKEMI
jgi:hypothetical protein